MKCTNRKQPPGAWDRIAELLRVTGMTANAFARHLGLPRGENLYQIKRGNNGISYDLARRIHAQYPNYSLSWLSRERERRDQALARRWHSRSAGTYGRWNRLRAGAVNGLLFRRERRAARRLLSRVPTECRARACAARSCCCDAATLRGHCSMATSILSSWQVCVCCGRWMRAGRTAPCALAERGAATRSSIARPSPRCGLSVPP